MQEAGAHHIRVGAGGGVQDRQHGRPSSIGRAPGEQEPCKACAQALVRLSPNLAPEATPSLAVYVVSVPKAMSGATLRCEIQ